MAEVKELLHALNSRLAASLEGVLAALGDDEIRYSAPAIDERPIGQIALHAYGGVVAFASTLNGLPWPGPTEPPQTVARLRAELARRRAKVDELIDSLPSDWMEREVTFPWGEKVSGLGAVIGAFSHAFVHVGNVGGIRAIGGFPTPVETY